MILKTAANYNDEGGYIEAWKNSDGTTEVKLIPKSGGGDEGKNGIKSVTISPAIETTPALDSLFPIYLEDMTEEQKQEGVILNLTSEPITDGEYTVTVTPSENWYVLGVGVVSENAGDPLTFTENAVGNMLQIRFGASYTSDPGDDDDIMNIIVKINV